MEVVVGQGLNYLGSITVPEWDLQQQEEKIDPGSTPVGDIWTDADVCWGSLVWAGLCSGYLVMIDVS